ncbi:PD40 domain-containing protein [Candidatus Uhrbacteria bacterium]|nr:PD40 domain-containing protein [Candidatus Uhrbacteria bacterium]
MTEKTRKLLVLLMMFAVVAAVGLALWYLFFRGTPPALRPSGEGPAVEVPPGGLQPSQTGEPTVIEPTVPGGLPPGVSDIAQGGLTAVSLAVPDRTSGASMDGSGNVSFYNRNDGRFYRLDGDGNPVSLSGQQFYNVDSVTFDPKGSKAIIEYPDGSNIFYDFDVNRQVTLPKHWEGFDFSPDGERIVAKSLGLDASNRYLVISNPDGGGVRPVQELGDNAGKVTVAWSPNNQVVAMAETGQSFGVDSHEIYLIGQNNENFKSLKVEGVDFRPLWSPDGERILYSVAGSTNDYRPQLWVTDGSGDNIGNNRRSLNVETWADKCTFVDSGTLYCGIPNRLEDGWGLQPSLAAGISDTIYRIDVNTGARTRIATPEGSHTIGSIMVSPDGRWLYFTDSGSGFLNRIQLK